ncbi:hypothetical protein UG54_19000, partial [Gordonia sihwensis]
LARPSAANAVQAQATTSAAPRLRRPSTVATSALPCWAARSAATRSGAVIRRSPPPVTSADGQCSPVPAC